MTFNLDLLLTLIFNLDLPLSTSTSNLHLTLKAWPVIALATIGLCFLTQQVASWFGITLPDQKNIEIVKQWAGWNLNFVSLCGQILILLPVLEELYFRYFIYRRSQEPLTKRGLLSALIPTAVILVAGAGFVLSRRGNVPGVAGVLYASWLYYLIVFGVSAVAEYVVRVFFCRLVAKTSLWSIAVFSSVLFSAAHYLSQPWPDAAFIALAFFGLAQCWLYRKTERIWCPMLNHAFFNLTNLVLLFVLPEQGAVP